MNVIFKEGENSSLAEIEAKTNDGENKIVVKSDFPITGREGERCDENAKCDRKTENPTSRIVGENNAETTAKTFGYDIADRASVIFGQSEDEMKREFRAFKIAKLLKKFDFDLTGEVSGETLSDKLEEAASLGIGSVLVTPQNLKIAKDKLKKTEAGVYAAVCYPFGEESYGVKKYAVKKAIEKGADGVFLPVGISSVKQGGFEAIRKEFKKIVKVCRNKKLFVVIESGAINSVETEKIVKILSAVGVKNFVSSSGYREIGEGLSSVKNIRYFLKSGCEVSGYTDTVKSDDAIGLLAIADRLLVKNAAELATDLKTAVGVLDF